MFNNTSHYILDKSRKIIKMLDFTELYNIRSELHNAIKQNDVKKLTLLVSNNEPNRRYVNLNYLDTVDGQSPLHKAARLGHAGIVKVLIENGASQHIQSKNGWFPLHLASFFGHMDIVMMLLSGSSESVKRNASTESCSEAKIDSESSDKESDDDDVDSVGDESDDELNNKFAVFHLD